MGVFFFFRLVTLLRQIPKCFFIMSVVVERGVYLKMLWFFMSNISLTCSIKLKGKRKPEKIEKLRFERWV